MSPLDDSNFNTNTSDNPDDWMKGEPGQTHTPRNGLPMTFFGDIAPELDTQDFVEGLLTTASLVVVYGEPGSGKSFWTLDLALHVAAGRAWNGREVDGGPVLYLALEGGRGVRNRIAAARRRLDLPKSTPFVLVQCPVDLRSPDADTERVIATLQDIQRVFGQPAKMCVVDTLSRAMAGGNENAPEDMGELVHNADLIRAQTGTCLIYIHHTGKDAARGARGHSSLKAATDTEIEVMRAEGASVAKVTRQRDLETEGAFGFRLDRVELGVNQRGKPVSSCVVVEADIPAPSARNRPMRDDDLSLKRHIEQTIADHGEVRSPELGMPRMSTVARKVLHDRLVAKEWLLSENFPDGKCNGKVRGTEWARLNKRLNALQNKRLIGFNREHVWLQRDGDGL